MADYFADTYAFFARVEGNPRYRRIFQRSNVVTSALNVLETYAVMLTRLPKADALRLANACFRYVVDVPAEAAFDAAEFKRQMGTLRRNCSTVDAWGYAAARRLSCPFLTGDLPFKGLANVAFVR